MAKKYISDVMKVADISDHTIKEATFIFITSTCEQTYLDQSELGEDLTSIETMKETLDLQIMDKEIIKEIKAIIRQATARDCAYIRIIE